MGTNLHQQMSDLKMLKEKEPGRAWLWEQNANGKVGKFANSLLTRGTDRSHWNIKSRIAKATSMAIFDQKWN